MRSVQAIFVKQAKDMTKNFSVLSMFVIFPLVAFAMTHFVARGNYDISDTMFTTMMASVFAGMALIQVACSVIAEDREKKSIRFLIIAGVKPLAYLMGIGGVILIASLISSLAFGYIGGFAQDEFIAFMLVMMSGAIASIILGATIGIYAKNRQAASGLSMPFAVLLGFAPMVAQFNERVESFVGFIYTQQINVVVNDFSAGLVQPLTVIWLNIAVLAVLFVIAYAKKGLSG